MAIPHPAAPPPRLSGAQSWAPVRMTAVAGSIVAILMLLSAPIGAADEPAAPPPRPAAPVSPGKPAPKRAGPGWLGPRARAPAARDKPTEPILSPRPWSRADGDAIASAALVGVDADAATLRFEDGREVIVPLDQLHRDDRHVALREQRRADRGRPDELPQVRGLVDEATPEPAPPPRPAVQPSASAPRRTAPGSVDVARRASGEVITQVLPGDASGDVVLVEIHEEGRRTAVATRLVWAAPTRGKNDTVEQELPAGERILDHHPTLELLLTVAQTPLGASALTPDVVTLWDASPRHGSPAPLARFFVSLHPLAGLPWARIVDDGLVVLLDRDKDVVAWDAWDQVARYRIRQKARAGALPVLCADRQRLLIPQDAGATIVDAAAGSPLATVSTDLPCAAAAFAGDGRRVALLAGGRIHVHDPAVPDEPAAVIEAPATDPLGGSIQWIDDDLIAVDNLADIGDFIVYSVDQRRPLWEYSAESRLRPTVVPGGVFYVLAPPFSATRTSLGTVVSASLPDPAAAKAARAAAAVGQPLIAPGSAVGVYTLCGRHDASVRDALMEIIERNGWTFDAKSPYTLAGYLFPQKPATIEYRTSRGDGKSAEVMATTAAIRIVTADRLLFDKASGRFEPGLMVVANGETPQEHLDCLLPPAAGFFRSVTVPDTIGGPGYVGPLGRSKLTLRGPIPAD